jgi:hypothetical protein
MLRSFSTAREKHCSFVTTISRETKSRIADESAAVERRKRACSEGEEGREDRRVK